MPFPEATKYTAPGNPFKGPLSQKLKSDHQKSLQDALSSVRETFFFEMKEPIGFKGEAVGVETSSEDFNAALTTVIAAIERGYHSSQEPTPLGPTEWARLSCAVLAAVGRGYCRQYASEQESQLQKVRAEVIDPNPLTKKNPTLFHRLACIADDIGTHVEPDLDGFRDWYITLKEEFNVKATKAAAIEIEEKFLSWKAYQFDRLANQVRQEIVAKARSEGTNYFMDTAKRLGLIFVRNTGAKSSTALPPTPLAGKRRSASGSTTNSPATPTAALAAAPASPNSSNTSTSTPRGRPAALARGRSRAAALSQARTKPTRDTSVSTRDRTAPTRDRTSSPPRRGRALTPSTSSLFRTRLDSLARPASPQSILTLSPNASLNLGPSLEPANAPPLLALPSGPPGLDVLMASLHAALGPAIKAAMEPYVTKLDALEKASMPPPVARPGPRQTPVGARTAPPPPPPPPPAVHRNTTEGDFTPVDSRRRKGKGKAGASAPPAAQPRQVNLTPASYAGAAASAASTQQPPVLRKPGQPLPTITEVTVLRAGGHADPETEQYIRYRAADAIVREVKLDMAKRVGKPITLRAGRWSIHPRSKGNFVFSFEGCIRFDEILSYENILLKPFYGSGQLCPSMGWTRFIVNGVPTWDEEAWVIFGPQALLEESRSLPGLKKATFAMQPRWLRPVGEIEGDYSSITFAISDPDGTITSTLLNSSAALFGKDVSVRKWIDKPPLIQCSRCHALGHNKASKACTLGKDSIKCHICGGAHKGENHNHHCPRKHAVAGICDCKHYKCLNCLKPGHDCRDSRCPARDLFRPRGNRKAGSKGKARAPGPWLEETADLGGAPYEPSPVAGPSRLPEPARTRQPALTAVDQERIDAFMILSDESDTLGFHSGGGDPDTLMSNAHEDPELYAVPTPQAQAPPRAYSPSRSIGAANHSTHA